MTDTVLSVVIRKKNGVVFSGEAKSITSYNERGTFDILPMHTNFVSVIRDRLEVAKVTNEKIKIPVERGVMRVKENHVEIYLEV